MPPLTHQSQHTVASLAELSGFAQALAVALRPGDLVALDGDLGAGKTTLVQHLGQALGLDETVSSPTFVLMNEYHSGPFPVAHVDLYRLGPDRAAGFADELYTLLDEGRALILVEWACYGEFLQNELTVAIRLDYDPERPQARTIQVSSSRPLDLP
jgi:tRNA threonylcarbamoyladenosine biosynthesis protein TsaE